MRAYEIYDEDNIRSVGTLLYYDKDKSYVIELPEDLDEWSAPLLFANSVKKGVFTISRDMSRRWVEGRVIPPGRQNIKSILATHRLKEYDEMKFLELSSGKCCQDGLCIRRLYELPEYVVERQMHNLTETVPLNNNRLLCFFEDGTTRLINLSELFEIDGVDKVADNRSLYMTAQVSAGGYAVSFNDSIDISARVLFETGTGIPLSLDDFKEYINHNIYDTSDTCEALDCSRQNISYMIKQEQLTPVRENVRGNLFLKEDVLKNLW